MHPTSRQTCQILSLIRTRNLSPASARTLQHAQQEPNAGKRRAWGRDTMP